MVTLPAVLHCDYWDARLDARDGGYYLTLYNPLGNEPMPNGLYGIWKPRTLAAANKRIEYELGAVVAGVWEHTDEPNPYLW